MQQRSHHHIMIQKAALFDYRSFLTIAWPAALGGSRTRLSTPEWELSWWPERNFLPPVPGAVFWSYRVKTEPFWLEESFLLPCGTEWPPRTAASMLRPGPERCFPSERNERRLRAVAQP